MNHEPFAKNKTLIVIAGPTASGKTAVAIELAKHYNTVVVSADSRQFYREMSIGTAKPGSDELAAAKHYFIDTLSISENYTVGDYEREALQLLNELYTTQDVVVLAGGSGLFIKAVCEGFDVFPNVKPGIREKLIEEFEANGIVPLQDKLKAADPVYYERVDLNNTQRVIRALEVFESSGKPYSSFRKSGVNERPFQIVKIGLGMKRDVLYDRINRRVDEMVKQGLVDEVRSLLPYRHLNALNTVGYSELFDYFDSKTDLETAITLIKQNTRRFAKRQMTWFNRDKDIFWVAADSPDLAETIAAIVDSLV
ncbi:MAG TPA: tRNA (adenosine(37)-N6)-dimethylallyltransferase MiaA [Mucilaginibacter sp.]|jgi:tRNA dimethylallyltransferase|nr:tRNA (adenosine(37)-N6)-dimethylallyltransferase MiaA [Mucilaginibacter sp.]